MSSIGRRKFGETSQPSGTVPREDLRLTVGTKVDRAVGNMTALVVADPEGQVVAINQGDCGAKGSATI